MASAYARFHRLDAEKRTGEHEERRAREMEVRQQDVDRFEAITRRDEKIVSPSNSRTAPSSLAESFQRLNDVVPTANDSSAAWRAARILQRTPRSGAPFSVHAMASGVVSSDRQKRSRANMQRQALTAIPAASSQPAARA